MRKNLLFATLMLIMSMWTLQSMAEGNIEIGGIVLKTGTYTNANLSAIKEGTVTFDKTTSVLTMDNVRIETGSSFGICMDYNVSLTIKLTGNNSISTENNYGIFLMAYENESLIIEGPGSLTINSPLKEDALYSQGASITIRNCTLDAIGRRGIVGWVNGTNSEKVNLTIDNATVKAKGSIETGWRTFHRGAIVNMKTFTLINCSIVSPEGAEYGYDGDTEYEKGIYIIEGGKKCIYAGQVIIQPTLKGDANNDSTVDVSDITAIASYILNPASVTINKANADANNDSTIDVSDITTTANIILHPVISHEYVDLGLPSGTLWATMNIGANKPEDFGDYFSWGETIGFQGGKTDFSWETYKWCNGTENVMTKYCTKSQYGTVDNDSILAATDDAATVNWGNDWRMPTRAEYLELTDTTYTTTQYTTQNEVPGLLITSKKNSKSIFLPRAASRKGKTPDYSYMDRAYYLTSTLSYRNKYNYILNFSSSFITVNECDRYKGCSVRPVKK